VILQSEFNSNDPNLFELKTPYQSKSFRISNGQTILEVPSIKALENILNISDRMARNVYYKNRKINGWERI
jgi:hypothetical protein